MIKGMTKTLIVAATSAASLLGAASADHRDHGEDHSQHISAEHAATSSGPAKAVDAFAVALASNNEKLVFSTRTFSSPKAAARNARLRNMRRLTWAQTCFSCQASRRP